MLQRRSSTASCTERNVDPVKIFSYDPIFQFQINSIGYVNTPMYILYIILTDFFFIVSEKPSKLTMGVCVCSHCRVHIVVVFNYADADTCLLSQRLRGIAIFFKRSILMFVTFDIVFIISLNKIIYWVLP